MYPLRRTLPNVVALPPVPQTIKVQLGGTMGSYKWMNILHVKYSGNAPTAAQLDTFNASVGTAWTTNLAPLAGTAVTLTQVISTDLTSNTSAQQATTMTHAGTRAGTQFTAQVAMVGSWQAPLRYRGGHFRTYFPFGVQTDMQTYATWTPAFITAAAAGLNAFRTALNGMSVGTAPVVMSGVSYFSGHQQRPSPLVVAITSAAVHGRIDTQRRRLGKEGP